LFRNNHHACDRLFFVCCAFFLPPKKRNRGCRRCGGTEPNRCRGRGESAGPRRRRPDRHVTTTTRTVSPRGHESFLRSFSSARPSVRAADGGLAVGWILLSAVCCCSFLEEDHGGAHSRRSAMAIGDAWHVSETARTGIGSFVNKSRIPSHTVEKITLTHTHTHKSMIQIHTTRLST
jgi:hypothetical protein